MSIVLHNSPWKYLSIVKRPWKKLGILIVKVLGNMKKTSLEILKSPEVLIIFLLEIEEPFKAWVVTGVNSACSKSKKANYLDWKCWSNVIISEIRISFETLKLYIKLKQTRIVASTIPLKYSFWRIFCVQLVYCFSVFNLNTF